MDARVLNFKEHASGKMVGFFDLAVGPLVVRGCKAFRKEGEDGRERLWFAWPASRGTDREGNEVWTDIVQAPEAVMRHLVRLVAPQIAAALSGARPPGREVPDGLVPPAEARELARYRSGNDDIPF